MPAKHSPSKQSIIQRRYNKPTFQRMRTPNITIPNREANKALVLEAFDTLFNKRDYKAAERFWSPNYIQHSDHIAPGREGLFNLIKSLPPTLKYEPGTIVAEGDFVIVHGRFSDFGQPVNWIAADILRIESGILVERWDVIQDEATPESSKSGLPMFGEKFGRSLQTNSKPTKERNMETKTNVAFVHGALADGATNQHTIL
jgi:predicted SnoaL-like aldol condensation-catalyzing enzyme